MDQTEFIEDSQAYYTACVRLTLRTEARTAAGQAGAAHSFFSSSISMSFCLPVDGLAMLSCAHSRQHTFERSCGQSGLVWRGDGRTFILA